MKFEKNQWLNLIQCCTISFPAGACTLAPYLNLASMYIYVCYTRKTSGLYREVQQHHSIHLKKKLHILITVWHVKDWIHCNPRIQNPYEFRLMTRNKFPWCVIFIYSAFLLLVICVKFFIVNINFWWKLHELLMSCGVKGRH